MDDVAVVAPRFFFTPSTLTAHLGASGAVLRQHVDPTSLGCQSPIAIADVDGDGVPDLLAACMTPSRLVRFSGATGQILSTGTRRSILPRAEIADVDGDGIRDQPGQRTFTEDVIINENELVGSAEIGAVVGQPFLVGGPGRVMELDAAGGPRARPP